MMSPPSPLPYWGIVPQPVRAVLQRLKAKAADAVDAMDTAQIAGSTPMNHDEAFLTMSAAAEAADRATRDYRSIFNAYVHKFHQPKPPIGELAAMQGTITQTFAKRYTSKTIAAIEALLSPTPDASAIRDGIRALGFDDLRGLSPALDAELARLRADASFIPWHAATDILRPRTSTNRPASPAADLSFDLTRETAPSEIAE